MVGVECILVVLLICALIVSFTFGVLLTLPLLYVESLSGSAWCPLSKNSPATVA